MKNLFFIILLSIVAFSYLKAQNKPYALTLEESILIAKEKSFTMRNLKEDIKIAEYNLQSATSRLKTHIDLNFTLPQFDKNITSQIDSSGISFYSSTRLDYKGIININQPLPTDGSISLVSGWSGYNNYNKDIRSSSFDTRIVFRQPINALYGYNAISSALKSAKLAYERTSKSLKREELNLEYQVSSAYYNLLSLQRGTEIALLDYERQTEANEISKNKFAAGLIREVDALQMEVDLAEAQNSYEVAVISQESAINSFKELLGIELSDSISLQDELDYEIVVIDSDKAVQLALENRTELREQEIAIELQKLNIKQQKANGMISGNIQAYVSKTGISELDINSRYTRSFQQSFSSFGNSPIDYGVGFTLSVPLLDWGENKALVKAAETRQRQNIIQKEDIARSIETETRNSVARLNNNLKRLQLLEKNVAIAEKSFGITRQRFADGDIDSQTLALERNRLNSAYRNHLSSYIDYQLGLADIMRKTLHDFRIE